MWANRKENKPAKMCSAMFRGKQKSTGKPTQNTIHKNMVQKVQWDLWWSRVSVLAVHSAPGPDCVLQTVCGQLWLMLFLVYEPNTKKNEVIKHKS